MEDRPDRGRVVEGQQPFPLEPIQLLPEKDDVGFLPALVVCLGAIGIGRIKKEERRWTVIKVDAALPVEMLDGGSVEAQVELPDRLHAIHAEAQLATAVAGV